MTTPWHPWKSFACRQFLRNTLRQHYPTESGRSSIKDVAKVTPPIKVPHCWHFWVHNCHEPGSTMFLTKVWSYRSSQFFNNISDVEKQVSGAWIPVLVVNMVKVTTARSCRIPTFWNYNIIVRMATTYWHSYLQSSRIPQWCGYVSIWHHKLSDGVLTALNKLGLCRGLFQH